MTMRETIAQLRRQGWRVRNGPWPMTLAAETRWDFCQTKSEEPGWSLWPMSARAGDALSKIMKEASHGQ